MEGEKNQSSSRLPRSFDGHHTLFTRRDFESRDDTKRLRDHRVLIIPMNKFDHGSNVHKNNKNGLHHDKDIQPLSKNAEDKIELPSEKFVKIALALCDINEPLRMSHVDRFRNVRDELDELCLDQTLDNETRRQAWQYSSNFSRQLPYMMRKPLIDESFWSWKYDHLE